MSEKYIQVENSQKYIELLTPLWISYMREIFEGDLEVENETDDEIIVGFAMYAIDLGGIKGIIDAGLGYIMELYIVPEFRRKGIASKAFAHMESVLQNQGALQIYLTPDSRSGVPFWETVGFRDCGKTDPDNKMPIYIKDLPGVEQMK